MGPFLFIYVAMGGFFAFAAMYHLVLWCASRRDRLLAIFSADCAVRAALSVSLAAIALSTTPAEAHAAIRTRVAIGMLMMITWLWSLSYVSGVRARWFVWPVTAIMLLADAIHSFVMPLNSSVVAIHQVVMPWGEVISNPQFGSPQGWWIRPLYGLGMVIAVFGLVCGLRLWSRDRMASILVVATASGTSVVFVVEVLRSYGMASVPFFGALPQVFWVCAIAFLIARDHHHIREQLAASEQRFRGIFDQTFQFIGLLTTDGTLIAANRTALEFAGLRECEVIGKPFWQTAWWTHSTALQEQLRSAVREAAAGKVVRFEATHPRAGGSGMACVDFSLKAVRDGRGRVTLLIPEGRDITERKRAEEALRMSQQQLASVFNASPLPEVCYSSEDGRILDVNQRFLSFFEVTREEAIGKTGWELGLWCKQSDRDELVARVKAEGAVSGFPARVRSRSGREADMLLSAQVIELAAGPAVILQANDVTERNRMDELVRASEERFRALVEHGFEGINIIDADGRLSFASPGNQSLLGHPAEHVRGRSIFETIHPDDMPEAQATWTQVLTNPERVFTPRLRCRHRDGSWHWVDFSVRNLLHHPAVQGVVVNWRDVTEQKIADEKLRESEERFRGILESLPMGVFIHDGRQVLYANPQALQMIGLKSLDENTQFNPFSIVAPEHLEIMHKRAAAVLQRGEVLPPIEAAIVRCDGVRVAVEITSRRTRYADRDCVQVLCLDIAERKRAEEERRKLEAQFVHAQKLESLAVLAGGVAHDFNNLLTVVLGNASLSLGQVPQGSPVADMLHEIEQAAQRAAELTQQMLAYSGKGKFVIGRLRLDELARDMSRLLRNVISKKATVELDVVPITVEGDATQLRQVVMNLLINASDALLDASGVLHVRTKIVHVARGELKSPFLLDELPAGEYALLEVEDSGCGMNQETQARIFDPFFTTKFTGRGLGLAAVLGIVRSHHGMIQVVSAPGQGTTFRAYFPCVNSPTSDDAKPAGAMARRGQGTILVVEDEPTVQDFTRRVLEHAGFAVRTTHDGNIALECLAGQTPEIIAVLLDLTMPNMDGFEFLAALRSLEPNLPVLVMSGFSEQDVQQNCSRHGANGFLQKPFDSGQLLARLFDILPSSANLVGLRP